MILNAIIEYILLLLLSLLLLLLLLLLLSLLLLLNFLPRISNTSVDNVLLSVFVLIKRFNEPLFRCDIKN